MATEMEALIYFEGYAPTQEEVERVLQQAWPECYVIDSTTEEY